MFQFQPKIEINVKMLNTYEDFTLEVYPSGAVIDIKRQIEKIKGIPIDKQTVYFAGKPRVDERLFKDCGIQVGSYITVAVEEPRQYVRPLWLTRPEKSEVAPKLSDDGRELEGPPVCEAEPGSAGQDVLLDDAGPAPARSAEAAPEDVIMKGLPVTMLSLYRLDRT